jgi:hypothetical protein
VTGSITGVDIELGAEAYSAAVLLDRATDTTVGIDVQVAPAGVPIAFSIPFDPATIDQSQTYVVGAGIVDGENRWDNRTGVPVITNGNPITDITVPVAAVLPPEADDGLGALGWIVGAIGLLALIAAAILYMRSRRPPEPEPAGAAAATAVAEDGEPAAAEGEEAGWTTDQPPPTEEPPTWGSGDAPEVEPTEAAPGTEPAEPAASAESAPTEGEPSPAEDTSASGPAPSAEDASPPVEPESTPGDGEPDVPPRPPEP